MIARQFFGGIDTLFKQVSTFIGNIISKQTPRYEAIKKQLIRSSKQQILRFHL